MKIVMAKKSKTTDEKSTTTNSPEWRTVAFVDSSTGDVFLIQSCVDTKGKTITIDGVEYPLYELDVSSKSHPFYVKGSGAFVVKNRKIDRFMQRMEASKKKGSSSK